MDALANSANLDEEDPQDFGGLPVRDWKAEIELTFEASDGRTRLARRRHFGPLVVQRPFYPEIDGTCHVYLLHPPAGIVGGDRLHHIFKTGENARSLLTTPGATKFYRSNSQKGLQHNNIVVAPGGVCEYLPQETIIFNGAIAEIETRVTLSGDATFVGWDLFCLGRPAAGEAFTAGSLSQRVEIVRDRKKIWFERLRLNGDSPLLDARFALGGQRVFGTMIYAGDLPEGLAECIRGDMMPKTSSVFSVSQLQQVVVCRYLGEHAEEAKNLFIHAWNTLRSACQLKPACPPRIWAT